jgi:hypothetical protein
MSGKDELLKFLDRVWGQEGRNVYLATKAGPDLFKTAPVQKWPERKDTIVQFILAGNAKLDIYFSPAFYTDNPTGKTKDQAIGSRVLWIDIDGYKDGQGKPSLALQRLTESKVAPMPTMRLQSSDEGAEHWYWVLDKEYPAETIENLNRRLAYFLEADTSCWNIDRVLRPPFTHNHKYSHKPVVDIIAENDNAHSPQEFEKLPAVRDQIKELIHFGEIPDIADVMMKYPWDDKHREIFTSELPDDRSSAIVRLAYFGAEVGMSDEALYAVINDVDNRWKKFVGRADRERRIIEIINKVREKYPSSIFTVTVQSTEPVQQIYGFRDFLNTTVQFNWIVDELIAEKTINFLTATPGVGKTRLSMQLAASLACGDDFLGWKIPKEKKVIFFSLEMGHPMLKRFSQGLAAENRYDLDKLQENLLLIPAGEPLPMASVEGQQFFKYVLDEVKPDVVIIDAMGSLSFEDIGEKTAKDIMNRLKAMLNEYGVTFYIIHHNRKPSQLTGDKPPTLADFYGNTYGATDAASVLGLWRPAGKNHVELHSLKSRTGSSGKPVLLKDNKERFTFSVIERLEDDDYSDSGYSGDKQDEDSIFGFGT